jgi:hypothetical protein
VKNKTRNIFSPFPMRNSGKEAGKMGFAAGANSSRNLNAFAMKNTPKSITIG